MTGHNARQRRMFSAIDFGRMELWMELKDPALLRQFMETQNVSGRTLAQAAGWRSHTYLQRLLRGEVKTLDTDPALKIAHFFGVPVNVLFLTRAATDAGHSARDRVAS